MQACFVNPQMLRGASSWRKRAFERNCSWCKYHIIGLDALGTEDGCGQAWSFPGIRVRLVEGSVLFKG